MSRVTWEGAQAHSAYGHLTWSFSGTEGLQLSIAGSLGNSKSINAYIFRFLITIQKKKKAITDVNIVPIHVQYSDFNTAAWTEKFISCPYPVKSHTLFFSGTL